MKFNIVLSALLSCFAIGLCAMEKEQVVNNLVHRKLVNVQIFNNTKRDYTIVFSRKKDAIEMLPGTQDSDIAYSENVPAGGMKNINLSLQSTDDSYKWVQGLKKLNIYAMYQPDMNYEGKMHWIKGLHLALHVTLASNNDCSVDGCYINNIKITKEKNSDAILVDSDLHDIINAQEKLTLDKYQLCLVLDGKELEKTTCSIEPYSAYQNIMQQGIMYCLKTLSALSIPSYEKDKDTHDDHQ